jgi:Sortase domain
MTRRLGAGPADAVSPASSRPVARHGRPGDRSWWHRSLFRGLGAIRLVRRPHGERSQPRWPGRHAADSRRRGAGFLLCGVLVCASGLTGLAIASMAGRPATPPGTSPRVAIPAGRLAALPDPARQQLVARPKTLIIPSIGVRTALIRLGRTAAGALQAPVTTTVAGWYAGSPRPGAIGSSVIAGHVDSYLGPGVFFRLELLRPGARIYVRRADGTIAEFRVSAVRLYDKDHFPTAAVYGPTPQAELRLVTCGGTFDHALGSYLGNVVVYAMAVSPPHATS